MSKVYILTDNQNRIIGLDGGYSIGNVDVETWTLIDEGEGDRYNLCQTHYLDKPLLESHGIPQYKYVDEEIVERTAEEIERDIVEIPTVPTMDERMDAMQAEIDGNSESIEMTEETMSSIMEFVLPQQANSLEEVIETLDTLMTTIIPALMGME